MNCTCADAECLHRKIQPKIFTLNGFTGTQAEYYKNQEKVKEINEWNEIFNMLEKDAEFCKKVSEK